MGLCPNDCGGRVAAVRLFTLVRRENRGEAVLLYMVPLIFIVTFAVVDPLFFGSFLGEGLRSCGTFWTSPLFKEITALGGVFAVLALRYLLVDRQSGRLTAGKVLLNVGLKPLLGASKGPGRSPQNGNQ